MDFESWLTQTLEHEGGFVNDPDDKGGATNFGITQKSYSEFKDRSVTIDEIETMTVEDAGEFYLDYWNKLGLDNVPEAIRPLYIDAAVNLGRGGASRVMQMACNTKLNPTKDEDEDAFDWIDVDGVPGRGTRAALDDANLTIFDYFAELSVWYSNLVLRGCSFDAERTNQNRFLRGWMRRLGTNLHEALKKSEES